MAAKKSVSPGPIDLMKEIMRLIAEPNSVNNKKRLEVAYIQNPSKATDPTTCNLCSDSTGFVCSGQYQKSLDTPKKYEEVRLKIKKIFDFEYPFDPFESFLEEVPIQRKFNVKLPARKQLDKLKMIRKNDRCVVCKKCVLHGRLVQCHHCTRLYHLNCLDPPIRDWDHSMRWVCPAHDQFLELAYPDVFTPGQGLQTINNITTKRTQCELPSMPVNKFFNIPSKIDAMYKKPEDSVPTTSNENSSLNILCDVASIALKSINSIDKTNETGSVTNYVSDTLLQKNKILPPKSCSATLSCLSVPLNVSIQREVLTIGKSLKNRLSLQHYGNCENISDYHATIRFDKKTGDFILKNLSRFGVIVDNVSYFGNRRKPSNNHELKKVDSSLKRHINKQRKTIQKDKIIQVTTNSDDEKPVIKYAGKKRAFNYKPMSKYYISKYKNMKHSYQKVQCKCSKRLVQKDGYSGFAILRNESIILIGCMKFKFTYDVGITEILKVCTDESLAKINGIVENKPFNESRLKCFSKKENGIDILVDTINNLNSFSINDNCSLKDADDSNSINEQNITNKSNLENSAQSEFFNIKVDGVSENKVHDYEDEPPSKINASEISNTECIKRWEMMNTVSSNEKSCFASDLIQEVEVNESSEDGEIIEEEIVYEMNYAEADNFAPAPINDVQDWLIEEIVIDEERNFNDNEPENSNDPQLTSTVGFPESACNDEDFKTEHMYCARSVTYDSETIIISDDDGGNNSEIDNDDEKDFML
uniref:PHD finger protein 21A n=1 Tax=Melanaphis sacchari TaxID=742174 RepID=A0A2H8TZ21_9HEMI